MTEVFSSVILPVTMAIPNTEDLFKDMSIDEAKELFMELKKHYILHLESHGLSYREVSRRLGGSTPATVMTLLKLYHGEAV